MLEDDLEVVLVVHPDDAFEAESRRLVEKLEQPLGLLVRRQHDRVRRSCRRRRAATVRRRAAVASRPSARSVDEPPQDDPVGAVCRRRGARRVGPAPRRVSRSRRPPRWPGSTGVNRSPRGSYCARTASVHHGTRRIGSGRLTRVERARQAGAPARRGVDGQDDARARAREGRTRQLWNPEYGRPYTEIGRDPEAPWTSDEFTHIARIHLLVRGLPRRLRARDVLFCDTDAFTTAVFHDVYLGTPATAFADLLGRPTTSPSSAASMSRGRTTAFASSRSSVASDARAVLEHARASGAPWLLVEGPQSSASPGAYVRRQAARRQAA